GAHRGRSRYRGSRRRNSGRPGGVRRRTDALRRPRATARAERAVPLRRADRPWRRGGLRALGLHHGVSMPALSRRGPGTASLVAVSCGTAIASVCAVGLFEIERLLGGVWSVAAVLVAGVGCFGLARACARLTEVLP